MVAKSMQTGGTAVAAGTPSGPVKTSRDCSGVTRQEQKISTLPATSATEPPANAPLATMVSTASALALKTWTSWPASISRPAMGWPIRPSPTKPIFMGCSFRCTPPCRAV